MIRILFFFFLIACATRTVTMRLPTVPLPGKKTPALLLPPNATDEMKVAARAFKMYGNSDEFFAYVKKIVKDLEAGNVNDVDTAINMYRNCLDTHAPIRVEFQYYKLNRTIGGWAKTFLAQNIEKELSPYDRAGHYVHELGHACGLSHFENDIVAYPSIKASFPYQVGNAFIDFLEEKQK